MATDPPGRVSRSTRVGWVAMTAATAITGTTTSHGHASPGGDVAPEPVTVTSAAAHAPIPKAT